MIQIASAGVTPVGEGIPFECVQQFPEGFAAHSVVLMYKADGGQQGAPFVPLAEDTPGPIGLLPGSANPQPWSGQESTFSSPTPVANAASAGTFRVDVLAEDGTTLAKSNAVHRVFRNIVAGPGEPEPTDGLPAVGEVPSAPAVIDSAQAAADALNAGGISAQLLAEIGRLTQEKHELAGVVESLSARVIELEERVAARVIELEKRVNALDEAVWEDEEELEPTEPDDEPITPSPPTSATGS